MNKIEVAILNNAHESPLGMSLFLAKLTQRGHKLQCMEGLLYMYRECTLFPTIAARDIVKMPHGTIKRFAPITIAVVGASRRFLTQARTHQVGLDYVSASLQYSDYSNKGSFVVPYEIMTGPALLRQQYLDKCEYDLTFYNRLINEGCCNDTAGYAMNQALRNILIIQGNHQSWEYFIRTRSCNRNTDETQYVAARIWEKLFYESNDGRDMFSNAGPDCLYGKCREGSMSCCNPIKCETPSQLIRKKWPLLHKEVLPC